MGYNKHDEEYINRMVTDHYWNDIREAFDDMADTLTHQIYFRGNYYQCQMIEDDFCIGAKYLFSEN